MLHSYFNFFFLFFRFFKRIYLDAAVHLKACLSYVCLSAILLSGLVTSVMSAPLSEDFSISDIRVDGLQRVSAGTIFSDFTSTNGEITEYGSCGYPL